MYARVCNELVESILEAMFQKPGSGIQQSFMFGKPSDPHWNKKFIVEIYYNSKSLTQISIQLREKGPLYLKFLPMSELNRMIQNFVSENYYYLAKDTYFKTFSTSYFGVVSEEARAKFANALLESKIFNPINSTMVYPLIPVVVENDFIGKRFFLVSKSSLTPKLLSTRLRVDEIASEFFPPISKFDGKKQSTTSWLGVISPTVTLSEKLKRSILGALILTYVSRVRHTQSMRQDVFGGSCAFDKIATIYSSQPHTPNAMFNISVTKRDHCWFDILDKKLSSTKKSDRRETHALEYFYRAWGLEQSERFPWLCMTLDAIFGDANQATTSVIDGARAILGQKVDYARLRLLMKLRASVIHGGAPNVYDSSKYAEYYQVYDNDPVRDLDIIVAECLRKKIFDGKLVEHADPEGEVIDLAKKNGQIPWDFSSSDIL